MGASSTFVRSDRIVTPGDVIDGAVELSGALGAGRIMAVHAGGDASLGGVGRSDLIDARGALVLPGGIDAHVHCNEPGRSDWEGFATATAAAAAGGITTLIDMPLNSSPVTTTAAAFAAKLDAAAAAPLAIDVGFWGGLVAGSAAELPALLDAGVLGVKAFLVDSGLDEFPESSVADLVAAAPALVAAGAPLLVHAEAARKLLAVPPPGDPDRSSLTAWAATRPPSAELAAIADAARATASTGLHLHVVHVATHEAAPLLQHYPHVTAETCGHYLAFATDDDSLPVGTASAVGKCAPPIRDAANREALWALLANPSGPISMVTSDHSPCLPAMKHLDGPDAGDVFAAWGGIAGVQFWLPHLVGQWLARDLPLPLLADRMAGAPARLAGLADRGRIEPGAQGNLVIVEPATWRPTAADCAFRHAISPWIGHELGARVRATILRGKVVTGHAGGVAEPERGQVVLRRR